MCVCVYVFRKRLRTLVKTSGRSIGAITKLLCDKRSWNVEGNVCLLPAMH